MAMSFLTLVLNTMIVVCGDIKNEIVISLSCWKYAELFFALLAKLNVNRS